MKALLAALLLAASPAIAHDIDGIILAAAGDQRRLDWYDSLKNHANVGCCDKNDGHQLPDGFTKLIGEQWFVYLEPEARWAPVPPQAVVRTPPSLDGQSYLFRMPQPVEWSPDGIRCFIPPIPGY